jgi:phenylacetate-CoA ligase
VAASDFQIGRTPLEKWIAGKIGVDPRQFTRQALADYQLAKINQTINLARDKSPFYKRKLADFPGELTCLEDLQKLPFTSERDLRRDGVRMLCVSQSDIQHVVTLDTSGTSGASKRCFFTAADQELTRDFFGVGMSCLVQPADKVLILLPGDRQGSVGDLLYDGLARQGIASLKYGPVKNISHVVKMIRQEKVTALVGSPTQILALARWSAFMGMPIPSSVGKVLLSTDNAANSIVESIKQQWNCEVFIHYGMTEMGLGGGVDCQAHHGLHLREADFLFEIIDPLSGLTLPDGATGEVVFSTLTRDGMPLIRYRTNDISRFNPDPCPCCTLLKTMDWVRFRYQSGVKFADQMVNISDFDEVLFSIPEVLDFKVLLNAKKKEITFNVFVIPDSLDGKTIGESLFSLKPMFNARRSGEFHLKINIINGLPDSFGSLAKRGIEFL